jgi:hypothetical protein
MYLLQRINPLFKLDVVCGKLGLRKEVSQWLRVLKGKKSVPSHQLALAVPSRTAVFELRKVKRKHCAHDIVVSKDSTARRPTISLKTRCWVQEGLQVYLMFLPKA